MYKHHSDTDTKHSLNWRNWKGNYPRLDKKHRVNKRAEQSWMSFDELCHRSPETWFLRWTPDSYEPPQKLGNTEYVMDEHWFMEIDGNC